MTPSAIQAGYRTIAKCDQLREACPARKDSKWSAALMNMALVVLLATCGMGWKALMVATDMSSRVAVLETIMGDVKTALNEIHPREGE